jgi:hypothetical protein
VYRIYFVCISIEKEPCYIIIIIIIIIVVIAVVIHTRVSNLLLYSLETERKGFKSDFSSAIWDGKFFAIQQSRVRFTNVQTFTHSTNMDKCSRKLFSSRASVLITIAITAGRMPLVTNSRFVGLGRESSKWSGAWSPPPHDFIFGVATNVITEPG